MIVPISRLSVPRNDEGVSLKWFPQTPGHGAARVWPQYGRIRGVQSSLKSQTALARGLSALPSIEPMAYRAKAAATSPSTRSMTPPWPGMMLPESFTP